MCPDLGHISFGYHTAQAHRSCAFVRADNRLRLYAITTTEEGGQIHSVCDKPAVDAPG